MTTGRKSLVWDERIGGYVQELTDEELEEHFRRRWLEERPRFWNGELDNDLTFTMGSEETASVFTEFWLNGLMVNGRNEKSRVIDEIDTAIAALLKEKFRQILGVDDFTVTSRLFLQDNAFNGPSLPTEQELAE